jgi:hypothetical protein
MANSSNNASPHLPSEESTHHRMTAYGAKPSREVSTCEYIATRLPTLKATITKTANPFKLLATLSLQQWLFFGVRVLCLDVGRLTSVAFLSP